MKTSYLLRIEMLLAFVEWPQRQPDEHYDVLVVIDLLRAGRGALYRALYTCSRRLPNQRELLPTLLVERIRTEFLIAQLRRCRLNQVRFVDWSWLPLRLYMHLEFDLVYICRNSFYVYKRVYIHSNLSASAFMVIATLWFVVHDVRSFGSG